MGEAIIAWDYKPEWIHGNWKFANQKNPQRRKLKRKKTGGRR